MFKKADALKIVVDYAEHLRADVEATEDEMGYTGMMGSMFGGSHYERGILDDRKHWALLLAKLYRIEEHLGTTDDEWWNGPKMDKPHEKADDGGMGYMMASMRDGEAAVQARHAETLKRYEREQANKHWTRKKEAQAQIRNPKRRFRIERDNGRRRKRKAGR